MQTWNLELESEAEKKCNLVGMLICISEKRKKP